MLWELKESAIFATIVTESYWIINMTGAVLWAVHMLASITLAVVPWGIITPSLHLWKPKQGTFDNLPVPYLSVSGARINLVHSIPEPAELTSSAWHHSYSPCRLARILMDKLWEEGMLNTANEINEGHSSGKAEVGFGSLLGHRL
jgi:hypothetical protein